MMIDNGSPSPSSHDSDNGSNRADNTQQEAVASQNASSNPKPIDYKMGSWTTSVLEATGTSSLVASPLQTGVALILLEAQFPFPHRR